MAGNMNNNIIVQSLSVIKVQFPAEINTLIVQFMDNINDVIHWKHTCRSNNHNYIITFYYDVLHPFLNITRVNVTKRTNLCLLKKRNNIKSIKINIRNNTEQYISHLDLEELYYEYGSYSAVGLSAQALRKYKNLRELKCTHMSFHQTAGDNILSSLTNLTYLDCCRAIYNPNSLASLVNLTYLDCSYIHMNNVDFLKCLTKLETLHIDKTCIRNEYDVSCLVNLKVLKYLSLPLLTNNIVRVLPKLTMLHCDGLFGDNDIKHLHNLTELKCNAKCLFTDISFVNLTNLTKLDLRHASIIMSCNTFAKLSNLEELYCGIISINDLSFINIIKKLKLLHCGNNSIMTDMSLKFMTNLTYLDCGNNTKFTDESVSQLTQLKTLYCGYNTKLTDVSLRNLPLLERLDCGRNTNFRSELIKLAERSVDIIFHLFGELPEISEEFKRIIERISRYRHY